MQYRYFLKKLIWHAALGVFIFLIVKKFSPLGSVYAGWTAGFIGACYLLAGWLRYLKSKGTDLLALIRRRGKPEVPYYLRGPEKLRKTKLSFNGNRHVFDDDEEEILAQDEFAKDPISQLRISALAFACTGALLLLLSFF